MSDQSVHSYQFIVPDIIKDLVEVSDVFLRDSANALASYGINLSFRELDLYRTLRSGEVSLLPGKVEAVLDLWEKKYLRHLQYEADRYRPAAVDRLNRDAVKRLEMLHGILAGRNDADLFVDWEKIERRGVFRVTPEALYGIPAIPRYIVTDADGRPADVKRLDQASRPDLEKIQSKFGAITKMLQPGMVKAAVDQELAHWNKKRSDIGVANAERRATLRQAQDIYDAAKSMFEGARESNRALLDRMRGNYERVTFMETADADRSIAIEEYCDLVMMSMVYPDEIRCNWLLRYVPESRTLNLRLDLPSVSQLDLPKSWTYSSKDAEVVEDRLSESELADLCDTVSYQILLRTMYDLFAADEAGVLDSISCNGEVAVQSSSSAEATSYVVLSVSADKQDVLTLDIATEFPSQLFEQLGGISAGAPHLVMPVEPID